MKSKIQSVTRRSQMNFSGVPSGMLVVIDMNGDKQKLRNARIQGGQKNK